MNSRVISVVVLPSGSPSQSAISCRVRHLSAVDGGQGVEVLGLMK